MEKEKRGGKKKKDERKKRTLVAIKTEQGGIGIGHILGILYNIKTYLFLHSLSLLNPPTFSF